MADDHLAAIKAVIGRPVKLFTVNGNSYQGMVHDAQTAPGCGDWLLVGEWWVCLQHVTAAKWGPRPD